MKISVFFMVVMALVQSVMADCSRIMTRLSQSAAANRTAIQKEVDAAAAAGGGCVTIPSGVWPTGSIELKSGVELHLEKGAVLKGSTEPADYNADDVFPENFSSVGEEWSGGHLVYAYKQHDIAITGEGTIDGNGGAFFDDCQYNWWHPGYKYGIKLFPKDRTWFRPGPMVALFLSKNIRLEGVTLANTPCWTCHIRCSDGVAIKGVTIDADRTIANSDGFSIDCTRNVTVEKCVVRTGDDGFAIRASCKHHAETNFCENIAVRDCDVWSCCHAVRLGVGAGMIRNVSFDSCRFHESTAAVAYTPAWVATGRNVYIENTRFSNCLFAECEVPVAFWLPNADARVTDALFEDCTMESMLPSSGGGTEKAPVTGVRFVRCARKPLLKGVKVRQDIRWLKENQRRIRREADLFATIGNAEVEYVDCSPMRGQAKGALLLSFDDRNFDDWLNALPVFDKYGAHATFFVSGEIDNDVVRKLKTYQAHGHSVGLHGLRHANADEAIAAKGVDRWFEDDLAKQIHTCQVCYVPIFSFAYPNCRRTEEADRKLYVHFERVRGGVKGATPYDPEGKLQKDRKPLVTNDAVFFPADELPKRRLVNTIIVGEAYHTDIDEICDCLRRAAKNREVISITSHGISPDAKHINMKTEWLETILKLAKELDLRVLGFDELPPPEDGE